MELDQLDRLFDLVEQAHARASVQAAFGEPQTIGEKTVIPVARVAYGFGLGFGQGQAPSEEEEEEAVSGSGGGGGAGGGATPIAVVEITPQGTRVIPVIDWLKIALAGACLAAWNLFWITLTIRAGMKTRKRGS